MNSAETHFFAAEGFGNFNYTENNVTFYEFCGLPNFITARGNLFLAILCYNHSTSKTFIISVMIKF